MQTDEFPIDETEETATPIVYRSISMPAVLGTIVAAFSAITLFHWLLWLVPLAAVLLCRAAFKQIRIAPTEYTGRKLAWTGIVAALALGIVGSIAGHYIAKYSDPIGYQPIKWEDLQPDPNNPQEIIPNSARELEPSDKDRDKRVLITGHINMSTTSRTVNIKQFILVPRAADCKFCQAQIKSTEMILITFVGGLTMDATSNEIKLGGKFKIDPEQAANPFGGLPYQIEADWIRE
jgi:hypothetical protein